MKTVKDVSRMTGLSIRTLRYYDQIGLLKPTGFTESGYRLYDDRALEKLQQIMFFRELEIPLMEIKYIMDDPSYDKEQVLSAQKALLEQKRNRLNGIIELIADVMKGVNTMSFEAFNNEEIRKIVDHTLECMSKEVLERQIQEYGSLEKVREHLAEGFKNEQAVMDIFKWYGGKEKAMEAALQSPKDPEEFEQKQDENHKIYRQFITAKETGDLALERLAVKRLAENYKAMFKLDSARNILLDLAKEYLQVERLAEVTDRTYGEGCAQYVANAIKRYYGV